VTGPTGADHREPDRATDAPPAAAGTALHPGVPAADDLGVDGGGGTPTSPRGAHRAPRTGRWAPERTRVPALSLALAALAGALWLLPVTREVVPTSHDPRIPWWLLVVVVVGCEVVAMHIQVRREAHAISLNELAVVVGLFFATPVTYLVARTLGSLVVSVGIRRQTPVKVLFNVSLDLAETALALLVFHAVLGPGTHIGLRAWAAVAAATVAVGILAAFAVTMVIAIVDGELHPRDLWVEPVRGVLSSLAITAVGLVAVHALAGEPIAAVPLAASTLLLLLGWRAYSGLSERHLSLERLYRFSHVVSSTPEMDDILAGVLQQAREVVRAEHADVVFVSSVPGQLAVRVDTDQGGALRRRPLTHAESRDELWNDVVRGEPLLVPRGVRDPQARAFLAGRGLRDAVVAPLRGEAGILGTILVGNRMGEVRTFDADDVQLLETVANHASMALRNGQLVHRLRHDALHDTLTGLPNRAALHRTLDAGTSDVRAGRSGGLSVLVLDLVGFKQVNDTFGHHLGDLLLKEVGVRMAGVIGGAGTFARLGGDEFAAVLPGAPDPADALLTARAVQATLEEPVTLEGVDIEVGVSIGVATSPAHGTDGHLLLKRADAAMYEAKSSGEGPRLYEAGLDDVESPARLALVAELRQGISAGLLEVHVQPQARLRDGVVVGAEALVRWRHPRHGLLGPDEFIGLAERSGLIRPLTTVVLGNAIAACGLWWSQGRGLSIAVNLSARSTITDETVDIVAELLAAHELPAHALTLEITESSIIRDPVRAAAVLGRFHELGVRLSIDDFGTGYSSLSYLRRLPVQEVKVDKSFVSTMVTQPEDATIVRSIVDLAANLGLAVVAEGVEDDETWDELAAMGCDLVQGYGLAMPMPMADFPAWLDAYRPLPDRSAPPAPLAPLAAPPPAPSPSHAAPVPPAQSRRAARKLDGVRNVTPRQSRG
jgi:diguanylate cyclase (GGDEF)-like protein